MLLLHNPNLGHIVSYDIRNLRPSRLDSDNGPLMVVDMNYPEFKSQLWNKQGPWRDSADGGHAGQRLPKDFYPNDTVQYDLDRNAGDTYFRGGIHNIKFWPAGYTEAAGKSSFVTVHYGPPYYYVRRYVGYGASPITGYQLQQEASQVTSWQVNNPRGDLSNFIDIILAITLLEILNHGIILKQTYLEMIYIMVLSLNHIHILQ